MQSVNLFVEHYIEPITSHPAYQIGSQVALEVIKVVASTIFLNYLGTRFLNHPTKISSEDVFASVVLAPLWEEIFFRGIVMRGIHCIQSSQLNIVFSPEIELPFKLYVHTLYYINEFAISLFSRISSAFSIGDESSESFVAKINFPIELNAIYWGLKKITDWIPAPSNDLVNLSDEEKKEAQIKQMYRIHLSSIIFGVAHFSNHHSYKWGALIQVTWSYFGGVVYGYLSEKYHSLAPGILAHGINNFIATLPGAYPAYAPNLFAALFVNRLACYIFSFSANQEIVVKDPE